MFYSARGKRSWPSSAVSLRTCKQGLLDGTDDWECTADIPGWNTYPKVIRKSRMRPDIVIHSQSTKEMIIIEPTVPYESKMQAAQIYKIEKYADLANSLKKKIYQVKVLAAEIGARGFVGASAYNLMKKLSIERREKTKA